MSDNVWVCCQVLFLTAQLYLTFCLSSLLLLFPLLYSDLVWENRGDWQHTKPRLCQEVHSGLLFRGEAEPAHWRVSYSVWSSPPRTRLCVCMCVCVCTCERCTDMPIQTFLPSHSRFSSYHSFPSFQLPPPSVLCQHLSSLLCNY